MKDFVSELDGMVGLRLEYQLSKGDDPVPAEAALSAICIQENSVLDLQVRVEYFGPRGAVSDATYRGEAAEINPNMLHTLINSAFTHLLPRRPKRSHSRGSVRDR